jgi:hypothetical protein
MDMFGTISTQIDAMNLLLFAVTLTAVPRRRTPVLLMLHWHAFRSADASSVRAARRGLDPVPASGLQINRDWRELAELDESMLDAAWRLGAWELFREERHGCNRVGASDREALECRQAFGDDPLRDPGNTSMVAEAPDREDMMHFAARVGYVRWTFRPVRGGVWRAVAADDTLAYDGSRAPPCPVGARPPAASRTGQTHYRLGRIDRLIVPG